MPIESDRPGAAAAGADDSRTFPTTRWSLVALAGGAAPPGDRNAVAGGQADDDGQADDGGHSARRDALGVILRRYLPALRAHLLARRISADRVDDLLQKFVADRVIERNLLARADRGRGRFRSFLLVSLDHFSANELRADTAQRRAPSGGRPVLSLDVDNAPDPAARANPSGPGCDAFDVAWAREALAEALQRMRTECTADGRADLWDVFDARVLAPAFDDAEPTGYDELARRHGLDSGKAAANVLVTAKRRFEQALREVLAEHAADAADLEAELAALGAALAAGPHHPPGRECGTDGE